MRTLSKINAERVRKALALIEAGDPQHVAAKKVGTHSSRLSILFRRAGVCGPGKKHRNGRAFRVRSRKESKTEQGTIGPVDFRTAHITDPSACKVYYEPGKIIICGECK